MNYLAELCNISGVSGSESLVASKIIGYITPLVDQVTQSPLGDVIAFKKGTGENPRTIMVSAHMDEVGFIITYITEEGLLRFAPVGGIDAEVMIGQKVWIGKTQILGLVGNKPIHLLSPGERNKKITFDDLYIDIGATSKEQAESLISLGDTACFSSVCEPFGTGYLMGKALDDRGGCAMMIELAKHTYSNHIYFVFSTREEVGGMGAKVCANTLEPEFALVLEFTTAGDNLGFSGADKVCSLGEGTVISFMDGRTIYDKNLYEKSVTLAKEKSIPHQTKTGIFGGNDAGVIHVAGKGVKTIAFSVPSRNLHTPNIVAKWSDIHATLQLAKAFLETIGADD